MRFLACSALVVSLLGIAAPAVITAGQGAAPRVSRESLGSPDFDDVSITHSRGGCLFHILCRCPRVICLSSCPPRLTINRGPNITGGPGAHLG